MRIAVYGTGGAGGYFGAMLAKANEDVTFIARGEHLRAIRTNGLVVETPAGDFTISTAQATDNPAEVGQVDLILIGVKAWQVKAAAEAIVPMVGSGTLVIPLQNGVEASSELTAVLGSRPVLGGLCKTFSWVTGPGKIKNITNSNFIQFGEIDNSRSSRAESLRQMFEHAGIQAEIPASIQHAIWMKFMTVTPYGSVGALTRAPIGVLRTFPQTRRLLERGTEEVFALSTALAVGLPDSSVATTIAFLDSVPASATSSLQRDIADGKQSELDYWTGAVVRLAKTKGISVPVHELIYDLLLLMELRARGTFTFPI